MALFGPSSPDSQGVATKSKRYATVVADINITALGGGPARAIRVGTAGNLSVDWGNGVTDVIPNLLAGETVEGNFIAVLVSGTTAAELTIFW